MSAESQGEEVGVADRAAEERKTGQEGGEEQGGAGEREPEEGGEEEQETSYNYEELKSGPEVVNMSEDTYLELQYPPQSLNNLAVCSYQLQLVVLVETLAGGQALVWL